MFPHLNVRHLDVRHLDVRHLNVRHLNVPLPTVTALPYHLLPQQHLASAYYIDTTLGCTDMLTLEIVDAACDR